MKLANVCIDGRPTVAAVLPEGLFDLGRRLPGLSGMLSTMFLRRSMRFAFSSFVIMVDCKWFGTKWFGTVCFTWN